MAKSKAQEEVGSSENGKLDTVEREKPELISSSIEDGDEKLPPFLGKQKSKLLQLRDNLLDSMTGISRDTLRLRAEGSEASAFGMHHADAGSDAYDRDFALSLLSQEQDALYEKRRSNASMPERTASAKCREDQFQMPGLRPSHLQELRSNARPKLKNKKGQCVSGSLSSPFSV
jgi:hypothetical protein